MHVVRDPRNVDRLNILHYYDDPRMDYSFSDVRYAFEPPPMVTSIWPVLGPALKGGTVVTVKGDHFKRGMETSCRFGGFSTVAHWVDAATLLCETPPHYPGLVRGRTHSDTYYLRMRR